MRRLIASAHKAKDLIFHIGHCSQISIRKVQSSFPGRNPENNAVRSLSIRNLREQHCSFTSWLESARTTLFAYFPDGICTNNAVRLLSSRNPVEQRCSFTSRMESAPTTLFTHLPTGICANNVVCSISVKNTSQIGINYVERASMPAFLLKLRNLCQGLNGIKVLLNFVRAKPCDLKSRAKAVFGGMKRTQGFQIRLSIATLEIFAQETT